MFDRVVTVVTPFTIEGVTIIIKNNTNHTIDNLSFKVDSRAKQKLGKLKVGVFNQRLVVNADLIEDTDLIIEDGKGKEFVFEKMVNRRLDPKGDKNLNLMFNSYYHFLKIEEGADGIQITLDEAGRNKFFENTQVDKPLAEPFK